MSNTWKFIMYHEKLLFTTTLQVQLRQVQCVSFSFHFYCVLYRFFWATLHANPHFCPKYACGRDLEAKGNVNTPCDKECVPYLHLRNTSGDAVWVTTVRPASQNNLLWHFRGTMSTEEWHLREFKSIPCLKIFCQKTLIFFNTQAV